MSTYTIKDIAKECGVGVSTVSRAINDHPDINPKTKQLIMKVVEERNFVPNTSARNLKKTENNAIAILIKGLENPLFHKMLDVFQREIMSKNYDFIFQRVGTKENELEVAVEIIKDKKIKGIVFLGGNFTHTENELKSITVPYVLSTISPSRFISEDVYSSISVDDVAESFKMTDYLCSLGHKKIAMLLPDMKDESVGNLRLKGYIQALEKNGIAVDNGLIRYSSCTGDSYSMENGYNIATELIESGREFTAVFAAADKIAVGAAKALLEKGYSIPEEISVAGFDGLDIGEYYNPSITTIKQPVEKMAKATINLLFNRIMRKTGNMHEIFRGELVVRESTGKCKKKR